MFIKVKGNKDDKIRVNTSHIKFIVPDRLKGEEVGSTIILGYECYVQTKSTISEIEQMLAESEGVE